ncbi:hypothetical protein B0H13DRAFT_1917023 [Mycena leptocephala]|nr:hypothetical protein B0H13DRAFT_1917023 [Mycena leptocephala]
MCAMRRPPQVGRAAAALCVVVEMWSSTRVVQRERYFARHGGGPGRVMDETVVLHVVVSGASDPFAAKVGEVEGRKRARRAPMILVDGESIAGTWSASADASAAHTPRGAHLGSESRGAGVPGTDKVDEDMGGEERRTSRAGRTIGLAAAQRTVGRGRGDVVARVRRMVWDVAEGR